MVGLRAGSPAGFVDPHPRLEVGGGEAPPSPDSLRQSRLEGGGGDAAWYVDDAKASSMDGRWTPASLIPRCEGWIDAFFIIRFTLISFYFLREKGL
jgi:hypothetical protein